MEIWAEKAYHYEKPVDERNSTNNTMGLHDMMPDRITWKSLISNGLCMGMSSPCVIGTCDVMCGYGRRYQAEKEQHAG